MQPSVWSTTTSRVTAGRVSVLKCDRIFFLRDFEMRSHFAYLEMLLY